MFSTVVALQSWPTQSGFLLDLQLLNLLWAIIVDYNLFFDKAFLMCPCGEERIWKFNNKQQKDFGDELEEFCFVSL